MENIKFGLNGDSVVVKKKQVKTSDVKIIKQNEL